MNPDPALTDMRKSFDKLWSELALQCFMRQHSTTDDDTQHDLQSMVCQAKAPRINVLAELERLSYSEEFGQAALAQSDDSVY